jgi:hypothetical protein
MKNIYVVYLAVLYFILGTIVSEYYFKAEIDKYSVIYYQYDTVLDRCFNIIERMEDVMDRQNNIILSLPN